MREKRLVVGVIGAVLLLVTPSAAFTEIVPWLVLLAAALFAIQPALTKRLNRSAADAAPPVEERAPQALATPSVEERAPQAHASRDHTGGWPAKAAFVLIGAYVFFVMAATEVVGARRQIVTALLLGVGSLHWSVLGATGITLAYLAMFRLAMPLLLLLGAVLPALLVALILRSAWRDLPRDPEAVRTDAPAPLTKGVPA